MFSECRPFLSGEERFCHQVSAWLLIWVKIEIAFFVRIGCLSSFFKKVKSCLLKSSIVLSRAGLRSPSFLKRIPIMADLMANTVLNNRKSIETEAIKVSVTAVLFGDFFQAWNICMVRSYESVRSKTISFDRISRLRMIRVKGVFGIIGCF